MALYTPPDQRLNLFMHVNHRGNLGSVLRLIKAYKGIVSRCLGGMEEKRQAAWGHTRGQEASSQERETKKF